MKKIVFALAILLSATAVNAQLTNTKWKVTLAMDNPIDIIFHFKKDAVTAFYAMDNSVGEEMTYTATDTSFTIKKIWGQSDCANGSKGEYRFEIKEGIMYVKAISDDCEKRGTYLAGSWTKM
ncbi:MAG TPA: hypothetical protein VNT20_01845 [Flavisolibacter sp.]|jgi:hypothetical protein|nr:hypothetical protein [Flavisolibacter sp.]